MLKCYQKELTKYRKEYNTLVTRTQAISIIKKLHRHYKTRLTDVVFTKKPGAGSAHVTRDLCNNGYVWKISLPKLEIKMGIVLHEYAHALTYYKYIKRVHHNKKFYLQLDRVIKYVRKKNHWNIKTPFIDMLVHEFLELTK